MAIRIEVVPFLIIACIISGAIIFLSRLAGVPPKAAFGIGVVFFAIVGGYLLYFFRDPHRECTADKKTVVAPADGTIASITEVSNEAFCQAASFCGLAGADLARFTRGRSVVRISTFLSLFDVHVNRAPISGSSRFLGYFKGKHLFTFEDKSSEVNQHNSILMTNQETCCLINQIVGPVCRRVVYWPDHARGVDLSAGNPIGMMKFGSRLDLYFPSEDITVTIKTGDIVRAGITPLATIQ
jgi:phosphatidylserine decarboxylase